MSRRPTEKKRSGTRSAPEPRPPRGASRSTAQAASAPFRAEKAPRTRDARPQVRASARDGELAWTYGIHAVESLLETQPETIVELWLQEGIAGGARLRLFERAQAAGVPIHEVDVEGLERQLGVGARHQGVAAQLKPFEYADASEILAKPGPQLIVVLDEVQDPHNLGAILRSARGWGAAGVVIPKHRAAGVTPTVRKVSTGAADLLPGARVTNLARFLDDARDAGFWVYGTAVDEGEELGGVAFADRAVLVMGSEGSGMRPLVRRGCDLLVRLPLDGVESLNVSVACGIFLYAWRTRVSSS